MAARSRCVLVTLILGLLPVLAAAQPRELGQADLVYRGSFTFENAGTTCSAGPRDFAYVQGVIAFNPARGSLFVVGHDHCQHVAEFEVPEAGGVARLLQPFRDPTGGRMDEINPSDPGSKKIGGLHVAGDRLIVSVYSFYDAERTARTSHFVRPVNLGSDDVVGPLRVGSLNPGFYAGYMAGIPSEWQPVFGGDLFTGQCCLSIITRTSFGPSVSVARTADFLQARGSINARMLVGYPEDNTALGDGTRQDPVFNRATQVRGVVLPKGTASVLFFGYHGTGPYCYGEADECGDPIHHGKGEHAFPYQPQVWAYRASELAEVSAGRRQPWTVRPYAVWRLPVLNDHRIGGVAYDEQSGRIFVLEVYGDGERPRVHVFAVRDEIVGGGGQTDGCSYALAMGAEPVHTGTLVRFPSASSQAVITVEPSGASCRWTAWSGVEWLTVQPEEGTGFGQVSLLAPAYSGAIERVGYAFVAGWMFTVAQNAPATAVPRQRVIAPRRREPPVRVP